MAEPPIRKDFLSQHFGDDDIAVMAEPPIRKDFLSACVKPHIKEKTVARTTVFIRKSEGAKLLTPSRFRIRKPIGFVKWFSA